MWSGWSTPRPYLFIPRKDTEPFVSEAVLVSGPVWTCAENLFLTGIRSPDSAARSESVPIPTTLSRPLPETEYLENVVHHGCNHMQGVSFVAFTLVILRLKCDGTRAETRFRLSAKQTSPFKSVWASVQSSTGSRVVRISSSNTGWLQKVPR
jgi:hypothetical protein